MAIIRFSTNIAQALHMRSLEGKPVESQFGGMQHMFTAAEGTFYVSDKVGGILADQFRALGVKAGDPVEITKAQTGSGPSQRTQWQVAVTVHSIEEPAPAPPSELETQLAASIKLVEARKAAARATTAQPAEQPAWAAYLVQQSNALIDAYAAVLRHSTRHEGLIKTEDVRSIFLSAFINVSKSSGGRNAA